MNWDRIEGNWKQLKGKVRETWGRLTDDQLDTIAGQRDKVFLVSKVFRATHRGVAPSPHASAR